MKSARYAGLLLTASAAVFSVTRVPPGPPEALVAQTAQAPTFEVDPFWPKPLPNHWVTGSTIGLSVDAQDNVWTIHRPDTVEANFKAADLKANQAVDDEVQPGEPARVSTTDRDRGLLQGRAARPRLRPGRDARRSRGEAPARGTTGRTATTASPSITRGTSGSPATGKGHAGSQVHERWASSCYS